MTSGGVEEWNEVHSLLAALSPVERATGLHLRLQLLDALLLLLDLVLRLELRFGRLGLGSLVTVLAAAGINGDGRYGGFVLTGLGDVRSRLFSPLFVTAEEGERINPLMRSRGRSTSKLSSCRRLWFLTHS